MESAGKTYALSTISTVLNDRKVYIAKKTHNHSSGIKVIVSHTPDMNQAKTWKHRSKAMDFIQKIVNPCGREYSVDTVIIKPDKSQTLAEAAATAG